MAIERDAAGLARREEAHAAVEAVLDTVLDRPGRGWWLALAVAAALLLVLVWGVGVLFAFGVGVWGANVPVVWAFDIINYVWWIGIANAASLLAAGLVLLRHEWRSGINRLAEAVALFAATCAAILPVLHLGRPWLFYWMFPYPNDMALWPQFRSPLAWDFVGILSHLIVVALFWYAGLVPDLAALRDHTRHPLARRLFGLAALGWTGSARQWEALHRAYILLAGLVVALLVFMQSIVALEFAATLLPGWHSTLLPPHFISGALVSGVGAILVLAIPLRATMDLRSFITEDHLDAMARILLGASLLVLYAEAFYAFTAWHEGDADSLRGLANRLFGPYGWVYWAAIGMVGGLAQLLWLARLRRSPVPLFAIALLITLGMWLDRFSIVVNPVQQDFLPSAWGAYQPTLTETTLFVGTLGLFAVLLVVYVRVLPVISVHEARKLAAGRGLRP